MPSLVLVECLPWTGRPGTTIMLCPILRSANDCGVFNNRSAGPWTRLHLVGCESACPGQGHDLLGVVQRHPRREDITARLVELDPHNATLAKRTAQATGLRGIDIVVGDAAMTYHYHGMVPANIVLACGVFGNITDQDIEHTLAHCPILRPRRHPDLDSTSQLTRPRAVDLPSARTSRLRAAMAI